MTRQAVILAAGRGKRLNPLTETRPKVMLPVANKPLIGYQIEKLNYIGIDEIGVVVGYKKDKIRKYLKDSVSYFEQKRQLGTGDALKYVKNLVKDDFLLLYGDLFFADNLSELKNTKTAMAVYKVKDCSRYGKVHINGGKVDKIAEKSESGSGFVNAGIYKLPYKIFDFLDNMRESDRKEYELTDCIQKIKPAAYRLKGYWSDIGFPFDYLDANMFALKKHGSRIGEGTKIWPSAILRKPVIIGNNCKIKNCVIESSVIGDNCTIGEFSVVKRSVVMSNSNVPHQNYVGDSVIGEYCNLGAGTKIANLRLDEKDVEITINDIRYDTGRRKFGAVIGDHVKTGINCSIMPGATIEPNTNIRAGEIVYRKKNKWTEEYYNFLFNRPSC